MKLRLATSENWKDKNTGDMQERTEWHTVKLFGKLAETAAEYLRKGSKVYIEGSLRTDKWQDNEGRDRYTTEIIARDMQMLDSRGGGGAPGGTSDAGGSYGGGPRGGGSAPSQPGPDAGGGWDDDVPF